MNIKHLFFALLFSIPVFAQQKQLETSVNVTKNKIGAAFKLRIKAQVKTNEKVVFPDVKNIGKLEVIESYPVDTVKKEGVYELTKKYDLTQFDAGKYTISSIKVLIDNKPAFSDSIPVEVKDVVVDTLQQKMYDIKPIIAVEKQMGDWWKYLLGFFIIGLIGFLTYKLVKKWQTKKAAAEVYKTPIEKATVLLNSLEKKSLWQKGDIKAYYSELTEIARNYIEEIIQIPAMESTSAELIAGLKKAALKKKINIKPETIQNLEQVLQQADLVKFAKSKPLDFEITEDANKIQKAILTLDNAVLAATTKISEEEMLLNEAQKQRQLALILKQKRKKRLAITIAVVLFLVLSSALYIVATKGFDYLKDSIIGHPTKELLEGEWVTSQYGNPAISISTPKVLKRMDLKKQLPADGLALIKDMSSFGYGSIISDPFYVMISTLKYKQDMQIDLSKSLEGSLKFMEAKGAQNLILKQQDFTTKQGVTGKRGFGTFTILDPIKKQSIDFYYEVIVFGQDGGLQQIIVLHEAADNYASQITAKMMESIALENLNN
jgi:hypothetical protein